MVSEAIVFGCATKFCSASSTGVAAATLVPLGHGPSCAHGYCSTSAFHHDNFGKSVKELRVFFKVVRDLIHVVKAKKAEKAMKAAAVKVMETRAPVEIFVFDVINDILQLGTAILGNSDGNAVKSVCKRSEAVDDQETITINVYGSLACGSQLQVFSCDYGMAVHYMTNKRRNGLKPTVSTFEYMVDTANRSSKDDEDDYCMKAIQGMSMRSSVHGGKASKVIVHTNTPYGKTARARVDYSRRNSRNEGGNHPRLTWIADPKQQTIYSPLSINPSDLEPGIDMTQGSEQLLDSGVEVDAAKEQHARRTGECAAEHDTETIMQMSTAAEETSQDPIESGIATDHIGAALQLWASLITFTDANFVCCLRGRHAAGARGASEPV